MENKNTFHNATILQNLNIIQMDLDYALDILHDRQGSTEPIDSHKLNVAILCIKNAMTRFNLLEEVYEEANK